jgi:hypothetical protein
MATSGRAQITDTKVGLWLKDADATFRKNSAEIKKTIEKADQFEILCELVKLVIELEEDQTNYDTAAWGSIFGVVEGTVSSFSRWRFDEANLANTGLLRS